MSLERFCIVLSSNPSGVYHPGQVVSGIVEIWNQHNKKFKGIYTEFTVILANRFQS